MSIFTDPYLCGNCRGQGVRISLDELKDDTGVTRLYLHLMECTTCKHRWQHNLLKPDFSEYKAITHD